MASKLVTLNDAAVQLGVTPDKLSELRQSGQIYGYRDGASWKFKADDIDRLREEMAFGGGATKEDKSDENEFEFGADFSITPEDDVLVSTDPASGAERGPTSTVIGKDKQGADKKGAAADALSSGDDDDFELSFDDDVAPNTVAPKSVTSEPPKAPTAGGSDILAGAIDVGASDSEVMIDLGGASNVGRMSDLALAGGSSKVSGGSSDVFGGGHDENVLVNPSPSALGSDVLESQTVVKKAGDKKAGSSVKLGDDDIFGGSTPGSDVTHRPSDSGILLIDPGDSGLSLEAPPEIGGSAVNLGGSNLHLSSDDATSDFNFGEASEIKADDDFLLTPLEEVGEDDSDSGSQVIMLDTEESDAGGGFGEATATLLASDIPGLSGMLEEESPLGGAFGSPMGGGFSTGGGVATAGAQQMQMMMVREAPFPGWLVAMLGLCTLTLGLGGAMMFDLMMNMWSWDGPFPVNSAIMDLFAGS